MSLAEYVRTLLRRLPLIVALGVIGGLASFAFAQNQTPMYRSTGSVLLSAEPRETTSELAQGSAYVSNLVDSYVQVATSELVLEPVVEDLELDRSPRVLANSVEASSPLNTFIIDISVVDADPVEAQRIAAAVTGHLTEAAAIVSPTSGNDPAVRLITITQAGVPAAPYEPNTRLLTAIGLLIGVGVGVAYALVRRLFSTTISDASDVQSVAELPVVGEVVEARGVTLPQAVLTGPTGREAESVRALVANLRFLAVGQPLRTFVITSANPRESKSSVAAAMAVMLGEASARVLLIDADLRAPTIADITNLNNAVGLSDVLLGSVTLEEAVQDWSGGGIQVLTSGRVPPNPAQMLSSDAMEQTLAKASTTYDYVVVDTAPLLPVTDALWLAHLSDGTLIVARRRKTTTRALSKVIGTLENAPVSGIVLSRMPGRSKVEYGSSPPVRSRRQLVSRKRSARRLSGGTLKVR